MIVTILIKTIENFLARWFDPEYGGLIKPIVGLPVPGCDDVPSVIALNSLSNSSLKKSQFKI